MTVFLGVGFIAANIANNYTGMAATLGSVYLTVVNDSDGSLALGIVDTKPYGTYENYEYSYDTNSKTLTKNCIEDDGWECDDS